MANIFSLTGKSIPTPEEQTPAPRPINQALVEQLTVLLAQAQSGELVALVTIGYLANVPQNQLDMFISGNNGPINEHMLLGALADAQYLFNTAMRSNSPKPAH